MVEKESVRFLELPMEKEVPLEREEKFVLPLMFIQFFGKEYTPGKSRFSSGRQV